jgi:hypothetical protein
MACASASFRVEGRLVRRGTALDQDGALLAQGVTNAELVEDVGVVDRDVTDDDVGLEDQLKHVVADVARVDNLPRRSARNVVGLQSGPYQLFVDPVEVDLFPRRVLLGSKRANDKRTWHQRTPGNCRPEAADECERGPGVASCCLIDK